MCYFLTIALPEVQEPALRAVVPRGFALRCAANESVLAALPKGFGTFALTTDGCSCSLYQREIEPPPPEGPRDFLRRKYVKKGWSEAKIQRAIRQSLCSRSRPEEFAGLRPDVVAILQRLTLRAPRLAVLVHWYVEGLDDERIRLGRPQRVQADQLVEFVPPEDRLVWITRTDVH